MRRHVALIETELIFPDYLTRVGIKSHDTFLKIGAAACRILYVNAVTHHDGSRAPAIRHAPKKILAIQGPSIHETRFSGYPIPLWAAQLGPVAQRNSPLSLGASASNQKQRDKKNRLLHHKTSCAGNFGAGSGF